VRLEVKESIKWSCYSALKNNDQILLRADKDNYELCRIRNRKNEETGEVEMFPVSPPGVKSRHLHKDSRFRCHLKKELTMPDFRW
jgi:hypothetical protein